MIYHDVIIIGAGPSGTSCAKTLIDKDIDVAILDKSKFPRHKLCAGWITPDVLKMLSISEKQYPGSILKFRYLYYHFYGIKIPVRTKQYSIRRYEFDNWMVERSNAPLYHHYTKNIKYEDYNYIIDNKYKCKFIIGAAGTNCPVYKNLFQKKNPRKKNKMIIAIEEEFKYDYHDKNCYLWFFDNKLPGYAWYVPKGNGYINIGLGGKFSGFKNNGLNILDHWELFIKKLEKKSLVSNHKFKNNAAHYYLRNSIKEVQRGNAFLIGDSAGLASIDMGEGIGPAIKSGILAALAIINGKKYKINSINRFSINNILKYYFSRM